MKFVQYEVAEGVALITLDRADKANAQTTHMLDELDSCWTAAAEDPGVRVVLVQANGRHFSAGMDLSREAPAVDQGGKEPATEPPVESFYLASSYRYFSKVMSWRNLPKPSLAAVQGRCVAAGLMLCWPCDLIIAGEDAQFSDPTMKMGLAGIEYMAHLWEVGPRKAKEMLFRSTPLDAAEACRLGMVNRVVPVERLREEAWAWAREIADLDPGMAALVKRAINGAQDAQGFTASLAHGFDVQELAAALQASHRQSYQTWDRSVLDHMREQTSNTAAAVERPWRAVDGS